MSAYPLLELSPRLRAALPVAGLLTAATPVQPLAGAEGVFLKRDDLSAAGYGGNKIRKLDFLLAAAKARGARELLTFGYAGSNFVAATAWHGRRLGLDTTAYLLPQADAAYVADNLALGLHTGAQLHVLPDETRIGFAALAHCARSALGRGRLPYWIPPGGSSPLGVAGFVNAALELRAQVDAGLLPEPQAIYVAFSSMGTVAGLALGLELAALPTRIVAVRVVGPRYAAAERLRQLLVRSARFLGRWHAPLLPLADAAMARVRVRTEFLGAGYAIATPEVRTAIARFAAAGALRADSAYSGKALACLYRDLDDGVLQRAGPVLFWHTFNAHGLPAGVARPLITDLPPALRRYFSSPADPG